MNSIDQGDVSISINKRGIATIEFFHPQSNSLPGRILSMLAEAIEKSGNDNEVKLIILI